MENISKALVAAQKEMHHALFDSTNPHFKNNYASLGAVINAVKPALNNEGIFFALVPEEADGGVKVSVRFIHESGETMDMGTVYVPADKQNAQGYGSALTYAKRYALASVCGIDAEKDDDGNKAADAPGTGRKVSVVQDALVGVKIDEDVGEEYVAGIKSALFNDDDTGLLQLVGEMENDIKLWVWSKLNSKERSYIKKLTKPA